FAVEDEALDGEGHPAGGPVEPFDTQLEIAEVALFLYDTQNFGPIGEVVVEVRSPSSLERTGFGADEGFEAVVGVEHVAVFDAAEHEGCGAGLDDRAEALLSLCELGRPGGNALFELVVRALECGFDGLTLVDVADAGEDAVLPEDVDAME